MTKEVGAIFSHCAYGNCLCAIENASHEYLEGGVYQSTVYFFKFPVLINNSQVGILYPKDFVRQML